MPCTINIENERCRKILDQYGSMKNVGTEEMIFFQRKYIYKKFGTVQYLSLNVFDMFA